MRRSPGATRRRLTQRLTDFAARRSARTRRLIRQVSDAANSTPFLRARKSVDWSHAEVVSHVDTWALLDELAHDVVAALTAAGLEAVRMVHRGEHTIVVPRESRTLALTTLISSASARSWWLHTDSRAAQRLSTLSADTVPGNAVQLSRLLVATNHTPVVGPELAVSLQFWRTTGEGEPRRDGGEYRPGTRIAVNRNPLAEYLDPQVWAAAQSDPDRLLGLCRIPHIFDVSGPIDAVYTWVDDADPAWRMRRAAAQGVDLNLSADALDAARTRSHDELRYSLRSLSAYASWIRHIWVVTDDQVPSWLDTAQPGLTVVSHKEIFTDPEVLPVFNSHAIESQLHHIPGLADSFLYFNDDVFLGRPVRPDAFFWGNGLSQFSPSLVSIDRDRTPEARNGASLAARQDRRWIEQRYQRTITNRMRHFPYTHHVASLSDLERVDPNLFAHLERSTFRNADDHAIASELGHYFAFAEGRATIGSLAVGYIDIGSPNVDEHLDSLNRLHNVDVFCLNDIGGYTTEIDDTAVAQFLERYFPVPSPFEKRDADA